MFLVAGLAVAGLAAVAAAFYFSIRSGHSGTNRLRPGPGRAGAARAQTAPAGAGRRPGSRSGTAGHGGHARADGRRLGSRPEPDENQATDPRLAVTVHESRPGSRSATHLSREAHASGDPAKSRRRMSFHKGVDEELWPTETFGGVSDEQFWDDLAADKPLTTTARAAQQDPGTGKRPLGTGPATDGLRANGEDRAREGRADDARAGEERGRGEPRREGRGRGDRRRGSGSGAYPGSRVGSNPATERTMIQPTHAATQSVPSATSQVPGATSQVPGAIVQVPSATPRVPSATPRVPSATPRVPSATPRVPSATSQVPGAIVQVPSATARVPSATPQVPGAIVQVPSAIPQVPSATPSTKTRGRRRASGAEEDPLTSAAFALRASGPVDGRSSLRSGGSHSAGSHSGGSGSGPESTYGGTGPATPYPYAGASHGAPSPATQTQATATPPDGENYGYGSRGPASQGGDESRRPNGTRSQPRHAAAGPRPARQLYPQDGHSSGNRQGAGGYPGNGYPGNGYPGNGYPGNGYPGNGYQVGGYPGNGHRGNGHRAPYDPRDDYRRLSHPR
jgi:hypothetical protein